MRKPLIYLMILLVVLLLGACKSKPAPVSTPASTRVPTTGAASPVTTTPSDTTTATAVPDPSTGFIYGTETESDTATGTASDNTSEIAFGTSTGITPDTTSETESDVATVTASDNTSETESDIATGTASDTTSETESGTSTGTMSDNTETASGTATGATSDTTPEIASGNASGTTSDTASGNIINRHQSGIILDGATTYTVRRGDTLNGIARRVYRDGSLYPLIDMVSDGIDNPDKILPGLLLTIPDVSVNMNDPVAKAAIDRHFLQIAQFEEQRGRRKTAEMIRNHTR